MEATQPVYDDLEADDGTSQLIDRIRDLKAEIAAPTQAACGGDDPAPQATAADGDAIPAGRYVKVLDRDTAVERGIDPEVVDEMLGTDGEIVIVLEIEDGRWTQHERLADGSEEVGDLGTFTYDAEVWVTVSESGGCRGCVVGFKWTVVDGVLSLALAPVEGQSAYDDPVRVIMEGDFREE